MQFTIKSLLQNKDLSGLELVAGKEEIDKVISNVNIIDNPDTYDWLEAGDFLLTTGYVFKDDKNMQRKAIRELSEINCAGLGIKVKRYFDEIPDVMLAEADKCRFPLIKIPGNYTLSQVSNVINNQIFVREDTLLKKSMKIHESINQCTLSGGDIQSITLKLSELVGNPIIVLDSNWNLLAYAETEGNLLPLEENLNLILKQPVFKPEFIENISRNIEKYNKTIKRHYKTNNEVVLCRILPVRADKKNYGYIFVWETVSKLNNIDFIALETAGTAIALERIKTRQIEEAKHQFKKDFFDDLLEGKINSVNAVNHLAELYNMNPSKIYVCMLVKLENISAERDNDYLRNQEHFMVLKKQLIGIMEDIWLKHNRKSITIQRYNLVISFLVLDNEEAGYAMSTVLEEGIKEIFKVIIGKYKGYNPKIGVGKPCYQFIQMKQTYFQAQEAIRISQSIGKEEEISYFDDYSIYHLLSSANNELLANFCEDVIGSLRKSDQENETEFIKTLDMYFFCNANISLTAKNLFIHRNTVIYRIEKIKNILNMELNDSEELLKLQLALHIVKIDTK